MYDLLHAGGAVDVRGFVLLLIDAHNGGQKDDRVIAQRLPKVGSDD